MTTLFSEEGSAPTAPKGSTVERTAFDGDETIVMRRPAVSRSRKEEEALPLLSLAGVMLVLLVIATLGWATGAFAWLWAKL